MPHTRRQFLRTLVGSAVGVAVASRSSFARHLLSITSPAGNALRIPTTFTGTELAAAIVTQEVFPGAPMSLWTMGGSYPAPTIKVRTGETFSVQLRNALEEPTIVHWHGMILPHDMDGHPMDAIAPGGTFDYSFPILNRAGTYWYHPHPHERTAPQVYMGMAGALIVSDDEEESLALPSGARDVPLIVQDRRVGTGTTFSYQTTATDRLNGLLGDTILVNGTPAAYLEVERSLYRFRVLNGSNARVLNIGFADRKKFHVIGTDGGLLDKPYQVESVYLGPAERVELLVDFSAMEIGTSAELLTIRFNGATDPSQQGAQLPIIRFDVVRDGSGGTIPATLANVERLDPSSAARTRVWELNTNPLAPGEHFHKINNKQFDMHRIDGEVKEGETEIWEIQNKHIMPHPIHVHGVQFQVLERINGRQIEPRDLGWKDTILVWGNETVRLIMRFGPYKGVYLIHCHNLEHEDHGMMLNYRIGDVASAVEERAHVPEKMDLR